MSTANPRLRELKESVVTLPDTRLQITRRWAVTKTDDVWAANIKQRLFQDWGTPDGVYAGMGAFVPRPETVYPHTHLVDQQVGAAGTESKDFVLVKVYETLPETGLLPVNDVQTETGENGLLTHIENFITKLDFPVNTLPKVGTEELSYRGKTLKLAGVADRDNHYAKQVIKRWAEPGILSRSEDLVGSQKAEVVEAFVVTPAASLGGVLANKQESNVGGVPTYRYTFLKPSILSTSEDKVGSQKAKVIEAFGLTPSTPSGYSLANEQESNVDGIKTRRYTFLKPSILSVRQDRVGGQQQVVVQAFDRTEAQVKEAVAEVTDDHLLVDVSDSDFEGIKTTSYTFNIKEFTITSADESGLFSNQRTELNTEGYAFQGEIGVTPFELGSDQLLAREEIDNENAIKRRTRLFRQKGILSVTTPLVGGQQQVQVQAFGLTEAEVIEELDEVVEEHVLVSVSKSNFQGFRTTQYVFEVELFNVRETTENGLLSITRTELDTEPFEDGVIGTDEIGEGSITLYLFREQIDNGNAIKRRVSRWLEAGILSISEPQANGHYETITVSAFAITAGDVVTQLGARLAGFVLQGVAESNVSGIVSTQYTFLAGTAERTVSSNSIYSLIETYPKPAADAYDAELSSTPEVIGGKTYIEAEKTDRVVGDIRYVRRLLNQVPADNATLVQIGEDRISFTENGLMVVEQQFVARAGHTLTGTVGTTEITVASKTVKLAANQFGERGKVSATVVKRWAEPGILDAEVNFAKDGILYVTFVSQGTRIRPTALAAGKALTDDPNEAFVGGAEAPLFRNRIRNVSGFRQYVTTVMLRHNGSKLESGVEVRSRTQWLRMRLPGVVDLTASEGIAPKPGASVWVLVDVTEVMTTSATVGATPVPWSIKRGAFANVRWIPTATGVAQSRSRGFGESYLGGSSLAGTETTFLGEPVTAVVGDVGSDPTWSGFLATNKPILSREIGEDMTTDEGVQWYRIRQAKMVGKFEDYL